MMVTRRGFLGLLTAGGVIGVAAVAGIQLLPEESAPSGDPVIKLGQENCTRCRMTISDARFASAWRDGTKERHFDDIECMVLQMGDQQPHAGTRFWVNDFRTGTWLDATAAFYAVSKEISTPMSYGIAASGTEVGVQKIVKDPASATFVRWEALSDVLKKRG